VDDEGSIDENQKLHQVLGGKGDKDIYFCSVSAAPRLNGSCRRRSFTSSSAAGTLETSRLNFFVTDTTGNFSNVVYL
jgi:hypothetical protein